MSAIRQRLTWVILWLGGPYRRLLLAFLAAVGPQVAYRLTDLGAKLMYWLLEPLKLRCEAQCRAALGDQVADRDVRAIAEQSYVHRARNLTDLLLTKRYLTPSSFGRFGGRIAQPHLQRLLDAQRRGQPVILVTAYYGPFDLLPVFLGYNGLRVGVVYKQHGNAGFDAFRRRVRSQSGCELIPVEQAPRRLPEILERGGTVGILADHHAEKGGVPATFLGIQTKAFPSVGLLAWRYQADVIVAGIRRVDDAFRFELIIEDDAPHAEWASQDDPVAYLTDRYLRALERMVLKDPTQYLWGYARWGEAFARKLTARAASPTPA
ncbi:MAG: lysophospholipid acyltransferase family protein [Planctomycetes bacterium]|nr:lysophospholipid acyltransferase family protein [Planctomycetota bacterium]